MAYGVSRLGASAISVRPETYGVTMSKSGFGRSSAPISD